MFFSWYCSNQILLFSCISWCLSQNVNFSSEKVLPNMPTNYGKGNERWEDCRAKILDAPDKYLELALQDYCVLLTNTLRSQCTACSLQVIFRINVNICERPNMWSIISINIYNICSLNHFCCLAPLSLIVKLSIWFHQFTPIGIDGWMGSSNRPSTTKYQAVPHIGTQYHQVSTSTAPYWPSTIMYQPVSTGNVAWKLQTFA